jgi:phosphate/sulfate permease
VANSLFSALAFALLIYASWMQREELIETRKEVSGQREALEAQVKHLERQGFERTFFEMLAVHRGVLASMSTQSNTGIEAIGKILGVVYQVRKGNNNASISRDEDAQVYLEQYESQYWKIEHYIGHYFRGLYSILQFIDSSEVENKRHYARVVRAQLSKPELSLLFHNGLSNHAKKMKPLIEKYALLKHCSGSQIKGYAALKTLYADSAFGLN